MKNSFVIFGSLMAVIFGGGFLIRLIRDADFYIAEFAVGVTGIVLLIVGLFFKKRIISKN